MAEINQGPNKEISDRFRSPTNVKYLASELGAEPSSAFLLEVVRFLGYNNPSKINRLSLSDTTIWAEVRNLNRAFLAEKKTFSGTTSKPGYLEMMFDKLMYHPKGWEYLNKKERRDPIFSAADNSGDARRFLADDVYHEAVYNINTPAYTFVPKSRFGDVMPMRWPLKAQSKTGGIEYRGKYGLQLYPKIRDDKDIKRLDDLVQKPFESVWADIRDEKNLKYSYYSPLGASKTDIGPKLGTNAGFGNTSDIGIGVQVAKPGEPPKKYPIPDPKTPLQEYVNEAARVRPPRRLIR